MYKCLYRILLFCFVVTNFCCKEKQDKKLVPDEYLAVKLVQFIASNQSNTFLIDSITEFEWDEFYIIKPYLPDSNYQALEKKITNLPLEIMPLVADWVNYLIFVKGNKAIKYIKVPRGPCCDFTTVNPNENPTLIKKGTPLYKGKHSNTITKP